MSWAAPGLFLYNRQVATAVQCIIVNMRRNGGRRFKFAVVGDDFQVSVNYKRVLITSLPVVHIPIAPTD